VIIMEDPVKTKAIYGMGEIGFMKLMTI